MVCTLVLGTSFLQIIVSQIPLVIIPCEYIKSYSPYENIRTDVAYPNMFITSSLFDTRVLYSEAVKYFARLQDRTVDKNTHLLKCRTEPSSHGGLSGRDNSIKELAEEFSFILKTADILN